MIKNDNHHHDQEDDHDEEDHEDEEENLSLAKEKLGLVSWLLLLLWLLAEPLSLDGDAKGAEIQLPADGDMIAHIEIHMGHIIEFTIHSKVEASPGPLGVSGGVGFPGTGECWKLDIPPEHEKC